MAEPTQYMFKHRDLVIAMIKAQGLTSGIWQLQLNFGFGAANVGPSQEETNPAAIIPVLGIGLQKVDAIQNPAIAVDAALENPAP